MQITFHQKHLAISLLRENISRMPLFSDVAWMCILLLVIGHFNLSSFLLLLKYSLQCQNLLVIYTLHGTKRYFYPAHSWASLRIFRSKKGISLTSAIIGRHSRNPYLTLGSMYPYQYQYRVFAWTHPYYFVKGHLWLYNRCIYKQNYRRCTFLIKTEPASSKFDKLSYR